MRDSGAWGLAWRCSAWFLQFALRYGRHQRRGWRIDQLADAIDEILGFSKAGCGDELMLVVMQHDTLARRAARPDRSYKHQGWAGWGDWLGFGPPVASEAPSKRRRQYRSFAEAREFVQSLGLGGQKDWFRYCRGNLPEKGSKPDDIPAHPREIYKNAGWIGFGDWVGTGAQKPSGVWRPFEDAREFARSLGLRNSIEWQQYLAGKFPDLPPRPRDIPANPHKLHAYEIVGWAGYPDWLGCKKIFKSYEEAKVFVRKLGLRTTREWEAYCRGEYPHKGTRPPDIPRSPEAYYRDKGWKDYKDWLGLE